MTKEHDHPPSQLTLEDVARRAQEVLLAEGAHAPTLIIAGYGQVAVVQMDSLAETSEARFEHMERTGFTFAQQADRVIPERVFFITEAWLSLPDKGQTSVKRAAEDPARKEVLIVSGLDMRQRGASAQVYEMIRDADGRLTSFGTLQIGDGEDKASRIESPLLEAFVQGFAIGLLDGPRN